MKKLLAIVAAHLRRFAGDSSDKGAEPGLPISALPGAAKDDFVSGKKADVDLNRFHNYFEPRKPFGFSASAPAMA